MRAESRQKEPRASPGAENPQGGATGSSLQGRGWGRSPGVLTGPFNSQGEERLCHRTHVCDAACGTTAPSLARSNTLSQPRLSFVVHSVPPASSLPSSGRRLGWSLQWGAGAGERRRRSRRDPAQSHPGRSRESRPRVSEVSRQFLGKKEATVPRRLVPAAPPPRPPGLAGPPGRRGRRRGERGSERREDQGGRGLRCSMAPGHVLAGPASRARSRCPASCSQSRCP